MTNELVDIILKNATKKNVWAMTTLQIQTYLTLTRPKEGMSHADGTN